MTKSSFQVGAETGLLLPFDGLGEDERAKQNRPPDAQGNPLDADTGEEEAEPAAGEDDLLAVWLSPVTKTRAWSTGETTTTMLTTSWTRYGTESRGYI